MNSKFGKVFVVEEQTAADGKTTTRQRLLESILFSNIDHKWYDPEGKLSPKYENYKGRPISLQFKIAHPDKYGQETEFTVKVPLPLKLGELKPQDLESVPEETQKNIELWESLGMLSGDPTNDDKSFKLTRPYFSAMSKIIEGKGTIDDILKNFDILPDRFKKPLKGLAHLRDVLAEKKQHAHHTYLALRDFHEGALLETCSEWKEKERKMSEIYRVSQFKLRLLTTGALAAYEAVLFDQDVVIGGKIRESFLYRSLVNLFLQYSSLVNDLWSCRKELAAGETANIIYVFHNQDGLTLENAYRKTIDKIAQVTRVLTETGELLIDLYAEEYPEAIKVVEIVKGLMYGNIQWSTLTGRYNHNSSTVYDCIVEQS